MEIKVSVKFWSEYTRIPDFAKETGLKFAIKKRMKIKRTGKSEREFYATTGSIETASLVETLAIVDRLYTGVLASPDLKMLVLNGKGVGEVLVASFGQSCELEDEISQELMKKIEESRVSLFLENYPLKENLNPDGHYFVRFE